MKKLKKIQMKNPHKTYKKLLSYYYLTIMILLKIIIKDK